MLVTAKEFTASLFTDRIGKLIFISNAMSIVNGDEYTYEDISDPTEEELDAPSLKLKVYDPNSLRESFCLGYINEELDEELIEAIKGESKNWKLIRCCTTLSHESGQFGFFFVFVNPKAYRLWTTSGREISHGESLENDKQMGIVWVHTECGDHDFKIIRHRYKKSGKLKKHAIYKLHTVGTRLSFEAYHKNFARIMTVRYLHRDEQNPNYERFGFYEEHRYL